MTTLLVTNIKGGVAKSSTAAAIATGLKIENPSAKVLLIDGDPQGSIKTYFGLKLAEEDRDFSSFLIDGTRFQDAIATVPVRDSSIDVMVSSRKLSEADIRMSALPRREETLRARFKKQDINYDYVVIDSSPAMNLVLLNFMTFADHWIIPATMDAFAISNINYLFEQKKMIEEFYDKSPRILGILPTMFDKRTTISQQALEAVKMKFGSLCQIFEPVAMDAAVKKAQIKRQLIYDVSGSRAAEAYRQLTKNLVGMI
jgi:chromosome partitioning protein